MSRSHPLVLGIETSCDDTACALVDAGGRVLASAVSSQLRAHRPYGGVVPEIASREHLTNWPAVSAAAFDQAGATLDDVGAVAATRGPGLIGCLLVGLSIGRAIAFARRLPFHAVHHLEGHVFSPFLSPDGAPAEEPPARFTALVVSGGHTSLLAVDEGRVSSLVETRDDAMGEVFDKVGKRLGLAYPQGPKVDLLAERGDPRRFRFRVHGVRGEPFFSYSGLKTQTLRRLEALERAGEVPAGERWDDLDAVPQAACDLLAAFRDAAVRQLESRLRHLHARRPLELLAVSGGVAANRLLRRRLERWAARNRVPLRLVPLVYAGDNAAMIAYAALLRQRRGEADDPRHVAVASRIPFPP
ncbi:MAG: tRNA (adenosine(37)-N6)-threonylcarbamoyltransferase complex transferase subunit TsaD [Acidobacteria bacterium]|nr:MAG: tRNA (adenosine(37)-N6)-threonylcarbamoyltransferase complex transferase subunit TsaD [Acidobacteriota bacterium]